MRKGGSGGSKLRGLGGEEKKWDVFSLVIVYVHMLVVCAFIYPIYRLFFFLLFTLIPLYFMQCITILIVIFLSLPVLACLLAFSQIPQFPYPYPYPTCLRQK